MRPLLRWKPAGFHLYLPFLLLIILTLAACDSQISPESSAPTATFGRQEATRAPTATIPASASLALIILENEAAVCADGSPAAYYFRASSTGSDNWLVHLPGGGYCRSGPDCQTRSTSDDVQNARLLSSLGLTAEIKGEGLLAADPEINPLFADYNVASLHYCSGDGWLSSQPATAATNEFHLVGRVILDAFWDDIELRNGPFAPEARLLLLGSGSGALGAVAVQDSVAEKFPQADVRSIIEGGWFDYELDSLPTSPGIFAGNQVLVAFLQPQLDQSCQEAEAELANCLPNPRLLPYLETPLFVFRDQFDPVMGLRAGEPEAALIRAGLEGGVTAFSTRLGIHIGLTDDFLLGTIVAGEVTLNQALQLWLTDGALPIQWLVEP